MRSRVVDPLTLIVGARERSRWLSVMGWGDGSVVRGARAREDREVGSRRSRDAGGRACSRARPGRRVLREGKVVVAADGGAWQLVEDGAVAVERVVQLADSGEDAASAVERRIRAKALRLLGSGEQLRMAGDEELDHEEEGCFQQRDDLGDGHRDVGSRGHRAPPGSAFVLAEDIEEELAVEPRQLAASGDGEEDEHAVAAGGSSRGVGGGEASHGASASSNDCWTASGSKSFLLAPAARMCLSRKSVASLSVSGRRRARTVMRWLSA